MRLHYMFFVVAPVVLTAAHVALAAEPATTSPTALPEAATTRTVAPTPQAQDMKDLLAAFKDPIERANAAADYKALTKQMTAMELEAEAAQVTDFTNAGMNLVSEDLRAELGGFLKQLLEKDPAAVTAAHRFMVRVRRQQADVVAGWLEQFDQAVRRYMVDTTANPDTVDDLLENKVAKGWKGPYLPATEARARFGAPVFLKGPLKEKEPPLNGCGDLPEGENCALWLALQDVSLTVARRVNDMLDGVAFKAPNDLEGVVRYVAGPDEDSGVLLYRVGPPL